MRVDALPRLARGRRRCERVDEPAGAAGGDRVGAHLGLPVGLRVPRGMGLAPQPQAFAHLLDGDGHAAGHTRDDARHAHGADQLGREPHLPRGARAPPGDRRRAACAAGERAQPARARHPAHVHRDRRRGRAREPRRSPVRRRGRPGRRHGRLRRRHHLRGARAGARGARARAARARVAAAHLGRRRDRHRHARLGRRARQPRHGRGRARAGDLRGRRGGGATGRRRLPRSRGPPRRAGRRHARDPRHAARGARDASASSRGCRGTRCSSTSTRSSPPATA